MSVLVNWTVNIIGISLIFVRLFFLLLRKIHVKGKKKVIGILHPDNLEGGGGERVMWCIVQAIQEKYPKAHIVIYSAHSENFKAIQKHIKSRFNLSLTKEIEIVNIKKWKKLYSHMEKYPFTLLLQSLASMIMSFISILKYTPHIWIDTTGFAFTYPLIKFFVGCKVISYVHYPTISTDMLRRVKNKEKGINNQTGITKSKIRTNVKILYYNIFAKMYGCCGYFADIIFVNSTWTRNHIVNLWFGNKKRITILFPPIAVSHFYDTLPLNHTKRQKYIVSIGCFRPEKNHILQVQSFHEFLTKYYKGNDKNEVKLILIGGVRNNDDASRVKQLKNLVKKLNIESSVEFHENASFDTLCKFCGMGIIGLHCMTEEHFGMCLVEYSASGLIPLAHNSGGPQVDIVVPFKGMKTGYLAKTKEEYAKGMNEIIDGYFGKNENKRNELYKIQSNTKESSKRFTEEKFIEKAKKLIIL